MAGMFKAIAHQKGYKINWGGDWKRINDMPHFEIRD